LTLVTPVRVGPATSPGETTGVPPRCSTCVESWSIACSAVSSRAAFSFAESCADITRDVSPLMMSVRNTTAATTSPM
jgi:hypothetical protein